MRFAHGWPIERDSPLLSFSSSLCLSSSASSEDDPEDEHERRLLVDDDETNEKHRRRKATTTTTTTTSEEEEEQRRRRQKAEEKEKSKKKKNIYIVSTSLDQTSRMLAIVTSIGGIELWDSGQNRTLLCAKMKSSSSAAASEYVCAEWKPNYYERENGVKDDDDDDESMSASHKERTLLVLTRAGNVLVFLVSVGNVEEFGRSSENNTSNNNSNNAGGGGGGGGSEQRCGTMRSASCVLKRAIKVKVVSNPSSSSPSHDSNNNNLAPEEEGLETSSASASSVATTFACAKDGQGVFFGTSRGGLAYADVFPKGKLYATTHSSDLVLKEILVANDVCAALAPKHHRRRTSRMSYSHGLGHTSGDEEYEDEDDEKRADFEFDDRYSDEDEEEYIRSISPREARKIATVNSEEEEEEEEEKEERQRDAVVSIRTTAAYREETSCVVALASGRCAVVAFSREEEKETTTEVISWLGDGNCSAIAAHSTDNVQRIAVGTGTGDVDIFSIVTSLAAASARRKKKIRFERRFRHSKEEERGDSAVCSLVWTKSGDALAVANSGKGMPLSVWSRVGTKLYAHESSSLLEEDASTKFNARCLCWNGNASSFYSEFSLFDVATVTSSSSSSSLKRSTFREISFVISPPDANVRVHPRNSRMSRQRYTSLSREEQLAASTKPTSGVLLGADRIVFVEDDDSDDSDKDDETTAATHYGEDDESDDEYGTSTRDGELVDENQYDSEADLFDNFSSSSSSLDVIEKRRFNDGTNGITDVANKAVLSPSSRHLQNKLKKQKRREYREKLKRRKEKRERDARISSKPPKPLRCRHELLPSEYIATRFPARKIAISPDGLDIAVAGSRGFVTYSLTRKKWRMFRDVSKEKRIRVTKMAWLTLRGDASGENKENEGVAFNALAVACSRTDDPTKHELRVYAAATQPLDEQCEIVKPHSLGAIAPVALDACGSHVLVISPPCEIALFEVRVNGFGGVNSSEMTSIGGSFVSSLFGGSFSTSAKNTAAAAIKAELRVARDVSGRRRVASGDESLASPIAAALWVSNHAYESPRAMPAPSMCALLRPCGTLSVLKLSGQNAGKEVKIKTSSSQNNDNSNKVSTNITERFWLAARSTDFTGNGVLPEVDNAWWTFGENGLEARHEDWDDLFMTVQEENDDDDEHDDDDNDGFDAHEFDEEYSDSFPISINLEQFRAICATRRLHHERSFGASGGRIDVSSVQKSILPLLLKKSLARRDVGAARILAKEARKRSRRLFSYALEWLIHDALEQIQGDDFDNEDEDEGNEVSDDGNDEVYYKSVSYDITKRELLKRSLNLAREFEEFPDVVVSVARKTDQDIWPKLFKSCGVKASTLLKAAIDRGRLRVASRGLVVSCYMDGEESGRELAYDILDAAFVLKDFALIGEVVRFLSIGFDMLDKIDATNDDDDEFEEEERGGGFFSMLFGGGGGQNEDGTNNANGLTRREKKEEIEMLRRERLILEKALEHKLDEIVFDVDARSLGAFYRRVPKEAFDVYDYFVREADGKCSFNVDDDEYNQDFDDKTSVLSSPPTSPTYSESSRKSPRGTRRRKKKEVKTKALGFSGALKRAVDTALSQRRLGGGGGSMSTGSSSSLFDNRDNDDDNDERYALEVVKRSKNLEWTLVLATLARDKKTLLELIDLKTSDVMYNAWRQAVESCIEDDADKNNNTSGGKHYFRREDQREEDSSSSEDEDGVGSENEEARKHSLKSYKRAFFAQLLADVHTESMREQKKKRGSQLNIVIPDAPEF